MGSLECLLPESEEEVNYLQEKIRGEEREVVGETKLGDVEFVEEKGGAGAGKEERTRCGYVGLAGDAGDEGTRWL